MNHFRLVVDGASGQDVKAIEIDGEHVPGVKSVALFVDVRELTQVVVTYACRKGVEFEGDANITHRCGIEDE